MACEYHTEAYKELDQEVIKILEEMEFQVTRLADILGEKMGSKMFQPVRLAANDAIEEVKWDEIPIEARRFTSHAALMYAAGFYAVRYSASQLQDQALSYVAVNAINDGNCYACVNDKDKAH